MRGDIEEESWCFIGRFGSFVENSFCWLIADCAYVNLKWMLRLEVVVRSNNHLGQGGQAVHYILQTFLAELFAKVLERLCSGWGTVRRSGHVVVGSMLDRVQCTEVSVRERIVSLCVGTSFDILG
jgi:hypothetical protein